MAKKRRLTRNQHRNAVKNKRNAKPGLKHRFKPKRRSWKYWLRQPEVWEGLPDINWSAPWHSEGGVKGCKARVESGMKCYCLEVCKCRNCDGCRTIAYANLAGCYPLCKTCDKHVSCR